MFLKIFRLIKLGDIRLSFERIFDKLGEIYPHWILNLNQILPFIITLIKFNLMMHFFSCGWILLAYHHDGTLFDDKKNIIANYIDSTYFMATTISTVGYGDINAKMTNDAHWAIEMVYMTCVIVASMIMFSSVVHEIFSMK